MPQIFVIDRLIGIISIQCLMQINFNVSVKHAQLVQQHTLIKIKFSTYFS